MLLFLPVVRRMSVMLVLRLLQASENVINCIVYLPFRAEITISMAHGRHTREFYLILFIALIAIIITLLSIDHRSHLLALKDITDITHTIPSMVA